MQCHRHADKTLDHCSVISETPAGMGFGDAAVVAASLSNAPLPPPNALTPSGDVIIPVTFDGGAELQNSKPTPADRIITNPDWISKPSGASLMRYFPDVAHRANTGGQVRMACLVTAAGAMDGCRIVSETPEGFGFGAASLAVAKLFKMRPRMVNGEPVTGGVVVIPLGFGASASKYVSAPVFAATPTPAEVAAAFPKGAARSEVGRVVLSCGVTPLGGLWPCQVATESPPGRGFGEAAKSLVSSFKLDASSYEQVGGISQVTLPILLYAPGAELIDPITKPVWTRMIDPKTVQSLFPAKAATAGLKAGKGTVDCILDHAGHLTQCKSVDEEPADEGFGEAIIRVAGALAINPWTTQGRPVDGAHIRLPMVLTLSPDAQASNTK